jgi:hypothetical protein
MELVSLVPTLTHQATEYILPTLVFLQLHASFISFDVPKSDSQMSAYLLMNNRIGKCTTYRSTKEFALKLLMMLTITPLPLYGNYNFELTKFYMIILSSQVMELVVIHGV